MDYRIYTTDYDETIDALEVLSDDPELHECLAEVRGRVSSESGFWDEGHLAAFEAAAAMLDAAIAARTHDGPLTFLLDNSGSMRGRPIAQTINAMTAIADRLDAAGVGFEILGCTTRSWRGGKARKDWLEAGRPREPGRLCELRHLIYKAADAPWRPEALDLMLKEGLLKENIDGEALAWARDRALEMGGGSIVTISDGFPVDEATLSVNPSNFLMNHLRQVVSEIESDPRFSLSGVMIGDARGVAAKTFRADVEAGTLMRALVSATADALGVDLESVARHEAEPAEDAGLAPSMPA
jgi:cobalamin biosynthesis protein CobT